ncbi:MAG: PilW family protein [Gammaproteobacteria bacterium]
MKIQSVYPTKQYGFSTIELMIATFLGLLIIAGVVELFISNKNTYRVQDGLARMQENARFAKHFLSTEIRMAGFQGCSPLTNTTVNIQVKTPPTDLLFSEEDVINGYEAVSASAWSPSLPTHLASNVAAGTDSVVIRKASDLRINIAHDMAQPTSAIVVADDRMGIEAGDILFITDCETTDIFATANQGLSITHPANLNTSPSLSKAYQTDAQVMHFESFSFYIKDTGRTNSTNLPIRALYYMDINGNEYELVEGISDMQITYGVDSNEDGAVDSFSTANTIESNNQWGQVVSVNIALLVNSVEEVSPERQAYTYNGATISNHTNRLLHRQLNTYITLRNRSL